MKYIFHYFFLDISFLLLLTWMVLYFLDISPRLPSTWQWIKWKKNVRVQLGALFWNLKSDYQSMKSWLLLELFIHCFGLWIQMKWRRGFIFSWVWWRPFLVCFIRWVNMGKLFPPYFQVRNLCCNLVFSRRSCCMILK